MAQSMIGSSQGGAQAAANHSDPVRVVLVGHSYVRRLNEYMTRRRQTNLGFDDVEVRSVFRGGARLHPPDSDRRRRMIETVDGYHPDFIFVHMGENDLRRRSRYLILTDLLNFVDELAPLCSSHVVIVGQLMHFPANWQLANDVDFINVRLAQDLPPGHILWCHRSGLSRNPNMYEPRGVHLNDAGNQRYWRSIRTIVSRVLRHSQP